MIDTTNSRQRLLTHDLVRTERSINPTGNPGMRAPYDPAATKRLTIAALQAVSPQVHGTGTKLDQIRVACQDYCDGALDRPGYYLDTIMGILGGFEQPSTSERIIEALHAHRHPAT